MTLQTRKNKLIQKITDSDNEALIIQLEQLVKKEMDLAELMVSIDDELDIDKLIKEQGFKNATKAELDAIIEKANISEPIDELLDMI